MRNVSTKEILQVLHYILLISVVSKKDWISLYLYMPHIYVTLKLMCKNSLQQKKPIYWNLNFPFFYWVSSLWSARYLAFCLCCFTSFPTGCSQQNPFVIEEACLSGVLPFSDFIFDNVLFPSCTLSQHQGFPGYGCLSGLSLSETFMLFSTTMTFLPYSSTFQPYG